MPHGNESPLQAWGQLLTFQGILWGMMGVRPCIAPRVCRGTRGGRVVGVDAMAVPSLLRRLLTGVSRCPLRVENGIFALPGKLVCELAWKHPALLRVSLRLCPRSIVKALDVVFLPVEEGERRDCVCPGPGEAAATGGGTTVAMPLPCIRKRVKERYGWKRVRPRASTPFRCLRLPLQASSAARRGPGILGKRLSGPAPDRHRARLGALPASAPAQQAPLEGKKKKNQNTKPPPFSQR